MYNQTHTDDPIKSVLCPGLGTAVGRMAFLKCAVQMRTAYDAVMFGRVPAINSPESLSECCTAHVKLLRVRNIIQIHVYSEGSVDNVHTYHHAEMQVLFVSQSIYIASSGYF